MNATIPAAQSADAGLPTFPFQRQYPLDPPPEYGRLRAESPLARVRLYDGKTIWLATRWRDVRAVLTNPSFSVDPQLENYPAASASRAAQVRSRKTFINMDPPDHGRFRRMLTREFMQKRMEEIRPLAQQLVDGLIDAIIAKGPPADLVTDFASRLPVNLISLLMGVPQADRDQLRDWSEQRNNHRLTPEHVLETSRLMEDWLEDLIRAKMAAPGNGEDILSRLAIDQINPGHITVTEAVRIASLLYSAGHGTTSNQIGLGILSLLQHPRQKALLEADLTRLPAAIEEMLRYHSIAHFNSARVATADVEIGGQLIRAGEGVYAVVAAANRDPEIYPDADVFNIERVDPPPHLAFAFGIHQCLGQPLARLELTVALTSLLERLPGLALAVPFEQLEFASMTQVHGLLGLPVTWDQAAAR